MAVIAIRPQITNTATAAAAPGAYGAAPRRTTAIATMRRITVTNTRDSPQEYPMHTLMTEQTFLQLKQIRDQFIIEPHLSAVAGIFVPWAGPRLREEGGLYYVGAATDGAFWAQSPQRFEDCYQRTADICNGKRHNRSGTPFWRFLDRLSIALFNAPYERTTAYWGWSNLLKIGFTDGTPASWHKEVADRQRAACIESLRQELAHLKDTTVFVASNATFGILDEAIGDTVPWVKADEDSGVYCHQDTQSRNLYIWGYHPKAAQLGKFFDEELEMVSKLAHLRARKAS